MSSLWLNLRVFYWSLQIGPDRPYIAIRFNSYLWCVVGHCRPYVTTTNKVGS